MCTVGQVLALGRWKQADKHVAGVLPGTAWHCCCCYCCCCQAGAARGRTVRLAHLPGREGHWACHIRGDAALLAADGQVQRMVGCGREAPVAGARRGGGGGRVSERASKLPHQGAGMLHQVAPPLIACRRSPAYGGYQQAVAGSPALGAHPVRRPPRHPGPGCS